MKKEMFLSLLPLETNRLIIRKTTLDDIDLLLKMDKQEITQMYLGGIKNMTKENRLVFLENKISNNMLTILLKDKTPIGFFGLEINENDNTGVINYIFDYNYSKNGYCTEICKKIVDIGFNILNLDKINADTNINNISSIKVLEKVGFKKTKQINEEFIQYSIIKTNLK